MSGDRLMDHDFAEVLFEDCIIEGGDFASSSFTDCTFRRVEFVEVSLMAVTFVNCDLEQVGFSHAMEATRSPRRNNSSHCHIRMNNKLPADIETVSTCGGEFQALFV